MFNIMVTEDDRSTMLLMKSLLTQHGYQVHTAENGKAALELLDRVHIDLILLDIMMPELDGIEFTRIVRQGGCEIPILMVTARETLNDKRTGFLSGADDYMVKPVDEEELLLRISALLRRSKIANDHKLTVGSTVLDFDALTVTRDGDTIMLPQKEFLLLFKLLSYRSQIFTRRQLMDELWDMESESDERTVDVHVSRLREKFSSNPDFEIITVRGLGYKAV